MTLLYWFALGDCGGDGGGGGGCGDDHVAVYIQKAEYPAESGCVPYLTGVFLNLLFCLILLLKGQCTAWAEYNCSNCNYLCLFIAVSETISLLLSIWLYTLPVPLLF